MYGTQKGHMGPLEQQEALVDIASSLPKYFPPNWKAAIYHVEIMGLSADEFIEVEQENGEIIRTDPPPTRG